jgi:hypothetical protein
LIGVVLKEGGEVAMECLVKGCGRWVKAGKVVCGVHARTEVGRAILAEVRELAREVARLGAVMREAEGGGLDGVRAREEAVREVRRRVERGDFAGLLGEPERRVAVEGALGRAFGDELAALRVALWRLVSDPELDVLDQARAVSEVVGMSVRAAKLQEAAAKRGKEKERRQILALLEMLGGIGTRNTDSGCRLGGWPAR